GNPQRALKDKGVIDSRCSRHMTRNMSYLFDFEEINGGYVAFGGNPKGGKIFGKGKIETGKLDFDDVYFVKEHKFNLFSVSQMCDKKNTVLFTDTECLVLSPEFKMPNENQVLLRVLKENNMHVVPTGVLTKSKLVPLSVARQVTIAVSPNNVTRPRPAKTVVTKPHSPTRRNINRRPSPIASTFPPKVNAAEAPMVNVVKGN
nr:ribonuclease H-like domain-containing protein [Tanacetum cinerariifolium]